MIGLVEDLGSDGEVLVFTHRAQFQVAGATFERPVRGT